MRRACRTSGRRPSCWPAIVLVLVVLAGAPGCLQMPGPSPAIPASPERVRAEWRRMERSPKGLERPLVVVDGWLPLGGTAIARHLRSLTGAAADEVLTVTYMPGRDFERLAAHVVAKVEERWPSDDERWTVEVDAVGFSAGGVLARVAATAPADGADRKRLRMARLFTISAPHRGTINVARLLAPDASSRQMRPGSATLARLDEARAGEAYELICYAQLNDRVVGVANAAPPGRMPIWTGGQIIASHSLSARNRRFIADIALRLRGEAPLAGEAFPPPPR